MTATIVRGRPWPFIDTVANLLSVPNKLLFLNADFESHAIDEEVERDLRGFIDRYAIDDVHIRLNAWMPLDELARLWSNRRVSIVLRATIGMLSWVAYCLNIGRLFGGDHYNPFSDTVNLYSNNRSIALHELGHVKDFRSVRYPGGYALLRMLPVVSLWQEYLASLFAVQYLRELGDHDEELAAYRLLFPAYSTYVFGALLEWFPSSLTRGLMLPVIAGGHVIGEAVARTRGTQLGVALDGRAGDVTRFREMFSPSTEEGVVNLSTGTGLVLGSSACGVLAPVGAWIGFMLARLRNRGTIKDNPHVQ